MKIAVMAEKPSLATVCLRACARVFPDFFENEVSVGYMNYHIELTHKFRYPHGLKWSDYPYSGHAAVYKPFSVSEFMEPYFIPAGVSRRVIEDVESVWRHRMEPDPGTNLEETLIHRLREADRIFFFVNQGPASVNVAERAVAYVFPDGIGGREIFMPEIVTYDEQKLDQSIAAGRTYAEGLVHGDYIANRQRFDYLYNINSMALLRQAVARCGGNPGYAPTKFELLLLYAMRDLPPMSEGKLINFMRDWPGTGKYAASPGRKGFGSPSSHSLIISHLAKAGLLGREERVVSVSAAGRSLLEFLPPACFDPDIPYRLAAWCDLPSSEATARIDRYIDTYFFKIKRRLGQPMPVAGPWNVFT